MSFASVAQRGIDTNTLKQSTRDYIKSMYTRKDFPTGRSFWDSKMFWRTGEYYKNERKRFADSSTVYSDLEGDIRKYYSDLGKYSFVEFIDITIASDKGSTVAYVAYDFIQTFKGSEQTLQSFVIWIFNNNGSLSIIEDAQLHRVINLVR